MKIKSIYINGLHNAVNKTYTFGDITYIFGHNGAGKSTILVAIQFALLGYIPGTAKNSKEALLRHSPTGNIVVRLELTDPKSEVNSVCIERILNKNGNTVNMIPSDYDLGRVIKDIELPIFNFGDFISQTANKLKEYFIKNILPTSNGELNWHQILTDSILDCNFSDRESIINYGMDLIKGIEGDTLEQIVAANTRFKEEQSFMKSQLQRLQNTIDSLIYYDDYTGPTDIDSITSQMLALRALRDKIIKYEAAVKATSSAKEELDRLNSHIAELGDVDGYNQCQKSLEEIKSSQDKLIKIIANKRDQLSVLRTQATTAQNFINSEGICSYTHVVCPTMSDKIETVKQQVASAKSEEIQLQHTVDKLNEELSQYRVSMSNLEMRLNDYKSTWSKIESLKQSLSSIPSRPDTDKTIFDIDVEISNLTTNKEKLQANIHYNETIEKITKEKYESELNLSAVSAWVKKTDTNGLQTAIMIGSFTQLADTMTDYIHHMWGDDTIKAHFNITSKANSFSFGIIRDGIYIPYDLLSSGEKCLYSLALMICIVNNCNSPLKLLLCDDMFDHLDNQTIENTFIALRNVEDIQFIFAGVKECHNAEDIMLKIE